MNAENRVSERTTYQVLRINHDACIVESAAGDRARHHEQRRIVVGYLRNQQQKETAADQRNERGQLSNECH